MTYKNMSRFQDFCTLLPAGSGPTKPFLGSKQPKVDPMSMYVCMCGQTGSRQLDVCRSLSKVLQ